MCIEILYCDLANSLVLPCSAFDFVTLLETETQLDNGTID
jgi:hypothetical protein